MNAAECARPLRFTKMIMRATRASGSDLAGAWIDREARLYLAASLCGAAIWTLVALVSGSPQAWTSALYFSAGMPGVCLLSMGFAFLEPACPARWGLLPMIGQLAGSILSMAPGSKLLPMLMVVFGVLSIPPIAAAGIAAFIAGNLRKRAETGPHEPYHRLVSSDAHAGPRE
jgi:hypothetical protein